MKSLKQFNCLVTDYLRAKRLVDKWELLSDKQKREAIKIVNLGASLNIAIQAVYIMGATEKSELDFMELMNWSKADYKAHNNAKSY